MLTPAVLELKWAARPVGPGQTPRRFLDFVVDGRSLAEILKVDIANLITPLGWGRPEASNAAVRQLLLEEPTVLKDNRPELYVCAECGDTDCGSLTSSVERRGDYYVWQDYAYRWPDLWDEPADRSETGPYRLERAPYTAVGALLFEAAAYAGALQAALR